MKVKKIKITEREFWTVADIEGRVDSFIDKDLTAQVSELAQKTKMIALDLSRVLFINLNFIRFMAQKAKELQAQRGDLVVVAPPQNITKHIEVYVGRGRLKIFRTIEDLDRGYVEQARSEHSPEVSSI